MNISHPLTVLFIALGSFALGYCVLLIVAGIVNRFCEYLVECEDENGEIYFREYQGHQGDEATAFFDTNPEARKIYRQVGEKLTRKS